MRSIFNEHERRRLLRRLDTLSPETPARWGRMNAHQMVCHLIDAVESSFAPSPPTVATGPLTRAPLKWLVINVLPWPRGKLESPPDLLVTVPTDWDADMARLHTAVERVAARGAAGAWPASDVFGSLSGREWGALLRTHMNHHLRQFGA
jgi:hypothetical protein